MILETNVFDKFDEGWPLLAAGNKDSFNMMTISWGEMGTLWGKPVATVFVRESRYTHEFMDREEYFTISFVPRSFDEQLRRLGSKSGRNIDKMHDSGLEPVELPHGIAFKEAETVLVCKKLFMQRLDMDRIPEDIREKFYNGGDPHDMYIGEVVEIK